MTKIGRRLFHLLGGSLFPALAFFVSRDALLTALGGVAGLLLVMEIGRFVFPQANRWFIAHFAFFLKAEESQQPTGSTYLLLSILLVFLVFEKSIAITSLFFLAIGDPVAAVIGENFGRRRFFHRSLEGSLAFFLCSIAVGMLLTRTSLEIGPSLVLVGAVAASVIEFLPVPLNDNLTVPLFSALAMALATLL